MMGTKKSRLRLVNVFMISANPFKVLLLFAILPLHYYYYLKKEKVRHSREDLQYIPDKQKELLPSPFQVQCNKR